MRKILITGTSGFIGNALLEKIPKSNRILDLSGSNEIDLEDKEKVLKMDYTDVVVHLAGKTPNGGISDTEFFRINLTSTINILEYCITKKIKKLIYVSSYVYGNPKHSPIDEKHPIQPHNAYAESKYIGERVCKFFAENSELNVIILRPFNIFGKSMKKGYLLSNLIESSKTNKKIKILNKNSKRDFLHLDDFIDVILKTLDYNCKFEIFNVGSGKSISFVEIISKIENILNKKLNIEYVEDEKKFIPIIESDITKIKKYLKWEPKINFDEGLIRLVK